MSATTTATVNASSGSIQVKGEQKQEQTEYKYTHLLPVFPKDEHYPPLEPFEHVDPGHRALQHPNPRQFLENAKVTQLTPPAGEEIRGINLATLTNDERDELALEVRPCISFCAYMLTYFDLQVAKRKVLVLRDQQDFIERGPDFWLEWGEWSHTFRIPQRDSPEMKVATSVVCTSIQPLATPRATPTCTSSTATRTRPSTTSTVIARSRRPGTRTSATNTSRRASPGFSSSRSPRPAATPSSRRR